MLKMSSYILTFLLFYFVYSCSNNTPTNKKVYEFLEVCYEDYYLNFDVNISEELFLFESHLISEGHLKDTSGVSYKNLLLELSEDTYFERPLEFDNFNKTILYKVPDDIVGCSQSIFGIDSSLVKHTPYFKAQKKIRDQLKLESEISINKVFKFNSDYVPSKTMTAPFVKQSILQLLYKWYFKSKYQKDTNHDFEDLEKSSDSTDLVERP